MCFEYWLAHRQPNERTTDRDSIKASLINQFTDIWRDVEMRKHVDCLSLRSLALWQPNDSPRHKPCSIFRFQFLYWIFAHTQYRHQAVLTYDLYLHFMRIPHPAYCRVQISCGWIWSLIKLNWVSVSEISTKTIVMQSNVVLIKTNLCDCCLYDDDCWMVSECVSRSFTDSRGDCEKCTRAIASVAHDHLHWSHPFQYILIWCLCRNEVDVADLFRTLLCQHCALCYTECRYSPV